MMQLVRPDHPFLVWVRAKEPFFNVLGAAVFIGGYVLAAFTGLFFPETGFLIAILVILGLFVGILNVTHKEIVPFLVAATALVLIGGTQVFTPLNLVIDGLGERANLTVRVMAVFTAPAAVIQAIRAGMHFAQPGDSEESS